MPCTSCTLTLAPATQRFDQKKSVGAFGVCSYEQKGKTTDIYALPHNTLPLSKDDEPNAKPWVNHFWMVQLRDDPKECNMSMECDCHSRWEWWFKHLTHEHGR